MSHEFRVNGKGRTFNYSPHSGACSCLHFCVHGDGGAFKSFRTITRGLTSLQFCCHDFDLSEAENAQS